ncbi:MAG TPA: hypothetical protein EYH38_05880 [Leucothrix sp.]|nr:hypothetical protein [Leucothrix sp.]
MTVRKQVGLVLVSYTLAGVLFYLFDIYACYDCSTERATYVYFLIGHTLLLLVTIKVIKNSSTAVTFVSVPLALWAAMTVLATLMWSIAPFLRYQ